jgi:hypothetical protein
VNGCAILKSNSPNHIFAVKAKLPTSANRMRRLHERCANGIVATMPLEIYQVEVDALVRAGLLRNDTSRDRAVIEQALVVRRLVWHG